MWQVAHQLSVLKHVTGLSTRSQQDAADSDAHGIQPQEKGPERIPHTRLSRRGQPRAQRSAPTEYTGVPPASTCPRTKAYRKGPHAGHSHSGIRSRAIARPASGPASHMQAPATGLACGSRPTAHSASSAPHCVTNEGSDYRRWQGQFLRQDVVCRPPRPVVEHGALRL